MHLIFSQDKFLGLFLQTAIELCSKSDCLKLLPSSLVLLRTEFYSVKVNFEAKAPSKEIHH